MLDTKTEEQPNLADPEAIDDGRINPVEVLGMKELTELDLEVGTDWELEPSGMFFVRKPGGRLLLPYRSRPFVEEKIAWIYLIIPSWLEQNI